MKITLKDGSVKEYENNMSVIDIAKDISEGLARVACAGEVDGEVVDLRTIIDKDCELNILTFDSDEGKHAFRLLFINNNIGGYLRVWNNKGFIIGQKGEELKLPVSFTH